MMQGREIAANIAAHGLYALGPEGPSHATEQVLALKVANIGLDFREQGGIEQFIADGIEPILVTRHRQAKVRPAIDVIGALVPDPAQRLVIGSGPADQALRLESLQIRSGNPVADRIGRDVVARAVAHEAAQCRTPVVIADAVVKCLPRGRELALIRRQRDGQPGLAHGGEQQ